MVDSSNLALEIDKYLLDKTYPYAIMIDGAWGSGKTFFIKQYIDSQLNNKHYIYISLYGMTDIREINKQIRIQYYYGSKFAKQKYELTRLGTSIAFDILEKKGIKEKYINQCLDLIKKGCINGSNIVLILDDLERSTVSILDILGHVNGLVEHQGYKVILLANEKEIDCEIDNLELKYLVAKDSNVIEENGDLLFKNSCLKKVQQNVDRQSDENKEITFEELRDRVSKLFFEKSRYNFIKEKVIGKTFVFKPNIKIAIAEILKNISSYYKNNRNHDYYKRLFELITNKENEVSEIMEQQSYINLRTYQFFLSKIFILYESLKNDNNSNNTNIYYLIDTYYIFIFKECLSFKQDKNQELNFNLLENLLSDYIRGVENSSDEQFVEKIWKFYDIVNSNDDIDIAVKAIYDWSGLNGIKIKENFSSLKENADKIDFMLYKRILSSLVYIDEYNIIDSDQIKEFILLLREKNNITNIPESSINDLKINHFENDMEIKIYKSYLDLLLRKDGIQVINPFEQVCNNVSYDPTKKINIFEIDYLTDDIVEKILENIEKANKGSEIQKIYYLLYDLYISNLSEWKNNKALQKNITSLTSLKEKISNYCYDYSEIDPVKKFWLDKMIEKIDYITNIL